MEKNYYPECPKCGSTKTERTTYENGDVVVRCHDCREVLSEEKGEK